MIEFMQGPLVWIAFGVFAGGSFYKLLAMLRLARRERTVLPTLSLRFGWRSLWHWLLPFGSRNMRARPVLTLVSFAFHICLLVTPLFAMGHAVLWHQAWGLRWWSLPPLVADLMSLGVVCGAGFFLLRRVAAPEVRAVSAWKDYAIATLVAAPFATGFVAHQQWLPPRLILALHIASGVLWLVAIPFTRLVHMLWFILSRAYMGSEFGAVRSARDW